MPFAAAIAALAPAVMTGHIAVRAVDRDVPASVSRPVTTGLLRRELGFDGLVVTDALDMDGVQQQAPGARAAVRSRAGADALLMPPDPRDARDAIVRAVRDGSLPLSRLDEAAARMIDTLRSARAGRGARPGCRRPAALVSARRSVTSVAGPCSGRLVPRRVRVVGAPDDVAAFDARLAARGVSIARDTTKRVRAGSRLVVVGHRKRVVKVRKRIRGQVRVVKVRKRVAVRERRPVYKTRGAPAHAPTVALVAYGGVVPGPVDGPADITVALDRPSVLGRVRSQVELPTYGDEPVALDALVDVLMALRPAPGQLPVDVPGASRRCC